MFDFIRKTIKMQKFIRDNKKIIESDLYYYDINEIPLLNWWKCSEGDLTYLWKKRRVDVPVFFKSIFSNMYFQVDYLDTSELRKKLQISIYENKYLISKDVKWKRQADTLKKELENKNKDEKESKLNDLIRNVSKILGINYYLNPSEITAGYFFSLYKEAQKANMSHGDN